MELRYSEGSAIRVLTDRVVLEATGASVRSTALQFARNYTRLQEGWRIGNPGWPMPSPATGMILAAPPETLNSLLRERLRRARLVTLHTDAERRRRINAELRQIYGGAAPSTPLLEALGARETILLLTPSCYRDLAAGRNDFPRRARAHLRNHPDALVLVLSAPGPMPLAGLLRKLEVALDRESDGSPWRTPFSDERPDRGDSREAAGNPDPDDTTPEPFF